MVIMDSSATSATSSTSGFNSYIKLRDMSGEYVSIKTAELIPCWKEGTSDSPYLYRHYKSGGLYSSADFTTSVDFEWETSPSAVDLKWMEYQTSSDYPKVKLTIQYGMNGWQKVMTTQPSPGSRIREVIRSRQSPAIHTGRRYSLTVSKDEREIRARETLRRVIGEESFRRFLRDGFVSVKAKSGLMYQIFPGSEFTKVYADGKFIETLCVILKGGFPPTDSLIMRYLLILNDEADFRNHANVSRVSRPVQRTRAAIAPQPELLTEIFSRMKITT